MSTSPPAARTRLDQLLFERDFLRTASRVADPRAARVVRDRDQPLPGMARSVSALVRAVRLQEGRLGNVLGVVTVSHDHQCVPIDVLDVRSVQPLEGLFT
jgi:hypothetical protein